MFRHIVKPFLANHKYEHCTLTIFRFIETQSASNKTILTDKQSFTVSYLKDSCGLSLQSAISASRLVIIKNTERSDSVLELFRSHGFSQKDISTLILRYPRLILAKPVYLRPKIDFFVSLGVEKSELPGIIISCKDLFHKSLSKFIIPTFDFLKCYIDVNANLIGILKGLSRITQDKKSLAPKVEILLAHSVPKSHIGKLLMQHPRSLHLRLDLFREVVKTVEKMGVDPESSKFIRALGSMASLSKPTWERKKEALMNQGWNKSDFHLAYSSQPLFMLTSENKMREIMGFLVNKVGVRACEVARCPNVLTFSVQKTLIPRWSVLQILMSKGLIEKSSLMLWMFGLSKPKFEARFVKKYEDEVPEVTNVYKNGIAQRIQ